MAAHLAESIASFSKILANAFLEQFPALRDSAACNGRCLPKQLERKLNLPGRGLCRGDETRAWNRLARFIEHRKIIGEREKIRAVHDVEKFGSELHIEALRNVLDIIVLENRKVQIGYPRPDQCIAPQIAPQIATGRVSKGRIAICRIERHVWRLRHHQTLSLYVVVGIA